MDHRAALHYTAAFLCAATIPKHYLVGQNKIKPAADTIPPTHVPTRHLITPTWFFCIAYLAMSSLLSVRWAQLGGPASREEKAIIVVQAIAGALCGWEYYKHKMYIGLGCLWAAPAATVAALL